MTTFNELWHGYACLSIAQCGQNLLRRIKFSLKSFPDRYKHCFIQVYTISHQKGCKKTTQCWFYSLDLVKSSAGCRCQSY